MQEGIRTNGRHACRVLDRLTDNIARQEMLFHSVADWQHRCSLICERQIVLQLQ